MHAFYERVDTLFQENKTNRRQFAMKHGFSYNTVSNYWGGDRSKVPPREVVVALAQEFGVTTDYLLLGKREPIQANTLREDIQEVVALLSRYSRLQVAQIMGAIQQFIIMARLLPGVDTNQNVQQLQGPG